MYLVCKSSILCVKVIEHIFMAYDILESSISETDVVTPPILNSYDGLYEVGRCHAADIRQKTTNHELLA
jgi:hypothetical protein